jgi:hypothetical protein
MLFPNPNKCKSHFNSSRLRHASTLEVGTSFNSLQEIKDACKAYSIRNAFENRIVKADKGRYTIVCKGEDTWRLHASSVNGSSIYPMKTYTPEHKCFGIHHTTHAYADYAFFADKIADKVKEQPSYRPVDIARDIQREMGVKISYSTAYRVKEHANELNNGTHDAAYQALPNIAKIFSTAIPQGRLSRKDS